MVAEIPPYVSAIADLKVKRMGPTKERVELADGNDVVFEVERHGDRWLVTAFHME